MKFFDEFPHLWKIYNESLNEFLKDIWRIRSKNLWKTMVKFLESVSDGNPRWNPQAFSGGVLLRISWKIPQSIPKRITQRNIREESPKISAKVPESNLYKCFIKSLQKFLLDNLEKLSMEYVKRILIEIKCLEVFPNLPLKIRNRCKNSTKNTLIKISVK